MQVTDILQSHDIHSDLDTGRWSALQSLMKTQGGNPLWERCGRQSRDGFCCFRDYLSCYGQNGTGGRWSRRGSVFPGEVLEVNKKRVTENRERAVWCAALGCSFEDLSIKQMIAQTTVSLLLVMK